MGHERVRVGWVEGQHTAQVEAARAEMRDALQQAELLSGETVPAMLRSRRLTVPSQHVSPS